MARSRNTALGVIMRRLLGFKWGVQRYAALTWQTAVAQAGHGWEWLISRRRTVFWVACIGIAVVALIVLVTGGGGVWLWTRYGTQHVVLAELLIWLWAKYSTHHDAIGPLLTLLAGLAVAGVALLRHFAQTDADRQRRITESFSKAIEQLGSGKVEVHLGGVYSLERISKESPNDYWTVMESLTAFVRERSHRAEAERTERLSKRAYFLWLEAGQPQGSADSFWGRAVEADEFGEQSPTDIASVLTVIRRRAKRHHKRETANHQYLDLSGAILRGADLKGAHLEKAALYWANLEGAELNDAYLQKANLYLARLERAILSNARLGGAYLAEADLKGADLFRAHLEGANLKKAHLERANLTEAHLEGANLTEAHLEGATLPKLLGGANFSKAYLKQAKLRGAQLGGAELSGAHLEGADLRGAHLEGAHLSGARLEGARLARANLGKARLWGAHLERADLTEAHLEEVYLEEASLEEAKLRGAYLERADLSGAHLKGANLSGTRLEGADLSTVVGLSASQLIEASGNTATQLPKGMDHPSHWL